MSKQTMSERCRRCREAGAEHEWRTDENGGFDFVYRCYTCQYYKSGASRSWLKEWLEKLLFRIEVMKYFYLRRIQAPGRD